MNATATENSAPFGTLLGYAPGVVAIYSSNYASIDQLDQQDDASFRNFIDHEYMGYKWQCVEFARRFLYLNYGMVFTDVQMAYEIFSLRYLRQVVNDDILPLQAFANGTSKRPPAAGSLLIWQQGGEFEHTGHVAIITQVLPDKVRVAEQNVIHHPLPTGQQWTRELPLIEKDGQYFIQDTFTDTEILGWMIQTADTEHSLPAPHIDPALLNVQARSVENHGQFSGAWLNEKNPLERAYVQANGHAISADAYRYYGISKSAEQELIRATNEMHLMYLHATDKVLRDDKLLALFDIPEALWPRVRLSWQRRRHHMITGRLDFCMDHRGLKVYEYNADSASCHAETGLILGKWAQQAGGNLGRDPGEYLLEALADAWKNSDAKPFVHILQDNDPEESYHAQFMQRALEKAGFASKILHGLDELHWNATGLLVDADNRPVDCVWKTWAWETALDQLREESQADYAAVPVRTGHPKNTVRLMDVLLRPEVMVFEPLWTVIPSNKAILPVLWSLFPHHRYLLDADFELNPELINSGYAVKPIAGRCGSNIGLVDEQEQVLDETSGNFAQQKNIYQELWCLPEVAGRYVQMCTFTVGGHYGGTCVRSEQGLVIKKESDIEPLRIFSDKAFTKL